MARIFPNLVGQHRLRLRRQIALPFRNRLLGVGRVQSSQAFLSRDAVPCISFRCFTCCGVEQFERRLVHAVEEREQLIILALGERIELVIVALAAADRQTEKDRADRVDPIDRRLHAKPFDADAAFLVDLRVAVKTRGDLVLDRGVSGSRSPASC